MPRCEEVETRRRGPIDVAGSGATLEQARSAASDRAWKEGLKPFEDWLHEPCPGGCPIKLIRLGREEIGNSSRAPEQRDGIWIAFVSLVYDATVVCLGDTARDTIELSPALPTDSNILDDPGEFDPTAPPRRLPLRCGLNKLAMPKRQEVGDLASTRDAAVASARRRARQEAERWLRDRLRQFDCPSNCKNRIEYTVVRTRIVLRGQFQPGGEWAAIAEATGEGVVYCLDDREWGALLDELARARQLPDPGELAPGERARFHTRAGSVSQRIARKEGHDERRPRVRPEKRRRARPARGPRRRAK